jgi:hypothetical protein
MKRLTALALLLGLGLFAVGCEGADDTTTTTPSTTTTPDTTTTPPAGGTTTGEGT